MQPTTVSMTLSLDVRLAAEIATFGEKYAAADLRAAIIKALETFFAKERALATEPPPNRLGISPTQ